jgi:hypothetical protein
LMRTSESLSSETESLISSIGDDLGTPTAFRRLVSLV